jgi:hypothetical protein
VTMEDSCCVAQLTASFTRQIQWYRELSRIVQKTLSQLVLSRGDVTPVIASVAQKNLIIDKIAEEREAIREASDFFRRRKSQMKPSPEKADLDRLLVSSESVIKEFLDGEDQLKRYLEFIMGKGENDTTPAGALR